MTLGTAAPQPVDLEPPAGNGRQAAVMPLGIVTALLLVAGLISAVVVRPPSSHAVSIDALARAASAVADAQSSTMTITFDMSGGPGGAAAMNFFIESDKASQAAKAKMTLPTGALDLVATKDFVYVAVPVHKRALFSAGKPWLKAPTPQTQEALEFGQVPDGQEYLELLAGAKGSVTAAGTESVEGETLRKYAVELDVGRIAERSSDPEKTRTQYEGLGVKTIPTTVWLTEDGALRQTEMIFEIGKMRAAVNMRVTTSSEPIAIEIPNDADCQPAPDMAAAMRPLIT